MIKGLGREEKQRSKRCVSWISIKLSRIEGGNENVAKSAALQMEDRY